MENLADLPATNSSSLHDLMEKVLISNHTPKEKIKLIDELRKNNPTTSDRWGYRWAIWMLGIAVLITIICIWCLAAKEHDISVGLISLGSSVA